VDLERKYGTRAFLRTHLFFGLESSHLSIYPLTVRFLAYLPPDEVSRMTSQFRAKRQAVVTDGEANAARWGRGRV